MALLGRSSFFQRALAPGQQLGQLMDASVPWIVVFLLVWCLLLYDFFTFSLLPFALVPALISASGDENGMIR